jgi:hypothetical protein
MAVAQRTLSEVVLDFICGQNDDAVICERRKVIPAEATNQAVRLRVTDQNQNYDRGHDEQHMARSSSIRNMRCTFDPGARNLAYGD